MAGSRFEYVRLFESDERLLPGCWVVIRLDGRGFTKFAKLHDFDKPNDINALNLSNAAAARVLVEFDEHVGFAFGQSDEYSFVLRRESTLFNRRQTKILSTIVSLFSSTYTALWTKFMNIELKCIPSFDGRTVCYPTTKHLRDYLSWRQADVHVNNLFNTTFWALVIKGKMTTNQAELKLKGTLAKDKHEILFSQFNINYNDQPPIFKKGSFLTKLAHIDASTQTYQALPIGSVSKPETTEATAGYSHYRQSAEVKQEDGTVVAIHDDIIGKTFWERNDKLLGQSDLDPPRIRKS